MKRNLVCVPALAFFQVFLVIMPVIVPFFESRGLSMRDVFVLQALFAVVVLAMEVPSGYLADVLGRKRALVLGSAFLALGHSLLLVADGFATLALFEACLGIGVSLVSGADLAILYDTEQALAGNSDHPEKVVGRLFSAHTASEALASVVCSLVLLVSLDATVTVQAVVGMLPLAFALAIVEPPGERLARRDHAGNMRQILRHLLGENAVLRYTFLVLCIWSLTTFYAVWLLQRHWQDQGIPLEYFGYLWGALMLVSTFAGRMAQRAERVLGVTTLLVMVGALPVVGYLGMGTFGVAGGLVASLAFFVARGLGLVVLRDALNRRVPGTFRATANSLASFGFRGAFAVTAPFVGVVLDGAGMKVTLFMLAAGSLAILVGLVLPLIAAVRSARSVPPPQPASAIG